MLLKLPIGTASQTLLTGVRLRLRRRLSYQDFRETGSRKRALVKTNVLPDDATFPCPGFLKRNKRNHIIWQPLPSIDDDHVFPPFADYTEEEEEEEVDSTPSPPADGDKLHIIIPLVVIGFLLIVVCVILVMFLQQRKKKRKDAVDNAHDITKKGSITMRDRLRAESLKSLDSRLLRLYDPNKLRQYPLDHVQYVRDLGEGFFGKVFQGTVYLQNRKFDTSYCRYSIRSVGA